MDSFEGSAAAGAVAFSLAAPSRRGCLRRFSADRWEIEMRSGCDHIVARTNKALSSEVLLDEAIEMAHRALDLTSVEDVEHLVTHRPADDYIRLQRNSGLTTVRVQGLCDFPVEMSVQVEIRRADGTVEHQPTPPSPAWIPAFRFHRLSQGSRDLFDAYRNMFLGLEALLDQFWPKRSDESEKAWLLRAVAAAGAKINLGVLIAPGAPDPARDLVDRLYDIRVHLFHAKTGRTLIPDERVSYTKVADAYPVLVSLWTEIVRAWLALTRASSAMTYQGFKMYVGGSFEQMRVGVTADDTPANAADHKASPKDMTVTILTEPVRIEQVRPGRIALIGRTAVSALPAEKVVGRIIVLSTDGTPVIVNSITGGLTLDGADVLDAVTVVRLINRGQPRIEFT